MKRLLLIAAIVAWSLPAEAHRPSDSYLHLRVEGNHVDGRWDIALRDLDWALHLDADSDGKITGRELAARQDDIAAYARTHLDLTSDGAACAVVPSGGLIARHSDGMYAVVRFGADCARAPKTLTVDYRLFFDLDPQHRGLITVLQAGHARTAIFRADDHQIAFAVETISRGSELATFIREGIFHIWSGTDHILFLIALLLPSVMRRKRGGWEPAGSMKLAVKDVLKVVTAFTLAHSITLALSVLDIVRLPERVVETGIAVTVALAALNNLFPVSTGRWPVAFALGLLHGFGFSNVLADLGVGGRDLFSTLFGFNLGVEIGQLSIVAAFIPAAYVLRSTWVYRRLTLQGGSVAIGVVAIVWSIQRALV